MRKLTIEIIDIECVLGHESCLHFFSCMPLHSRHIEFSQEWEFTKHKQSYNFVFLWESFALLFNLQFE